MAKDHRITYRRRHSYRTATNRIRPIKTPGGRFVAQYIEKKASVRRCADTGKPIAGIPRVRPFAMRKLSKNKRTVSRVYGGYLCASALRQRIVRAFLLEEQKVAKKLVVAQKKAQKKTPKAPSAPKAKKEGNTEKKTKKTAASSSSSKKSKST